MNNKVYDILKTVATIWLPALAVLITAVFEIWNIPGTEAVVGVITACTLTLNAILKFLSTIWWEDKYIVQADESEDDE